MWRLGGVSKVKVGKPRNYDLGNGVVRFSKSKMFHKKAKYRFVGKKNPKPEKPKKPSVAVKQIGGEKNGGTRTVLLRRRKSFYPTQDKIRTRPHHKTFSKHIRRTRPTLTPGTICILLAGRHAGKRVVLVGVLENDVYNLIDNSSIPEDELPDIKSTLGIILEKSLEDMPYEGKDVGSIKEALKKDLGEAVDKLRVPSEKKNKLKMGIKDALTENLDLPMSDEIQETINKELAKSE